MAHLALSIAAVIAAVSCGACSSKSTTGDSATSTSLASSSKTSAQAPSAVSVTTSASTPPQARLSPKNELTPIFCQKDREFPNKGGNYCAPTSLSDGIVYLARADHVKGFPEAKDKEQQATLIEELAADLSTDPVKGTSIDELMTGLRKYVESRSDTLSRLEVYTWRKLSPPNKKHLIAMPEIPWIREAAADSHVVVIFGVGWYKKVDGTPDHYERHYGHYIEVFEPGDRPAEFHVRNPDIETKRQRDEDSVVLTKVGAFHAKAEDGEETDLSGQYEVEGPGLPHSKDLTPVIDHILVFAVDGAR